MSFYQAMQEALASPRYFSLQGGFDDILNVLDNILDRIFDFLSSLFNAEFAGFGDGVDVEILSGIFIAVAVFIVLATVMFCVRLFLKRRKKEDIYSDGIFEEFIKNKLSFDEIMARAKSYDEENNLKEASRYRYLGMIMLFSAKEIVNVTESMTGGQFELEAMRNMPSVQSGVRNTINMYYNLFFGHKSVSLEDYAAHLRAYDAVMKEASGYEKS